MNPIPFFIIAAFAVGLGITQVSTHQREAALLVRTIVEADKAGNDPTIAQQRLASHIHDHMGTSASYMLEGSYRRDMAASQAASNPSANGQVYAQAQAACAGKADSVAQAHCVQNYLASHATASANPRPVAMPQKNAYTKTLRSSSWTNDSAGIAFLAALVAAAIGVATMFRRRDN